jgi:hypothetical protein
VADGLDLPGSNRQQLGLGTRFAQRADRFGQFRLLHPIGGDHGNSQVVQRGHGILLDLSNPGVVRTSHVSETASSLT